MRPFGQSPGIGGGELQRIRAVTVLSTNFDGSFHWGHPAWLLHAGDGIVLTSTDAGLTVKTETGHYVSPFNTRACYWPDRWYNVIRLEEPDKGFYGYYCNIASPLRFDGETVEYTDLQLDVRILPGEDGLRFHLVDEDEFQVARDRFGYDDELVTRCYAAVEELRALFENKSFPFEG